MNTIERQSQKVPSNCKYLYNLRFKTLNLVVKTKTLTT